MGWHTARVHSVTSTPVRNFYLTLIRNTCVYICDSEAARICPFRGCGSTEELAPALTAPDLSFAGAAPKSSKASDPRGRQILGAATSLRLPNPRGCQIRGAATSKSSKLPNPRGCHGKVGRMKTFFPEQIWSCDRRESRDAFVSTKQCSKTSFLVTVVKVLETLF